MSRIRAGPKQRQGSAVFTFFNGSFRGPAWQRNLLKHLWVLSFSIKNSSSTSWLMKRAAVYQRRRPERSAAYQVVRQNLETWLALRSAGGLDAGADWVVDPVPAHVERDLRKYLECDTLAHGFARAKFYSWRFGRDGRKAGMCAIYLRYSGRCPRAGAYSI